MVCFWWYAASPARVLGLAGDVPSIPCVACILNVGCFFSWDFFVLRDFSTRHCDSLDCVVLEGFWQVIQSLLVLKGEISHCSYSLLWSVFLACGFLLLSGCFFLYRSGQCSDPRESSVHWLHSYTYLLRSSLLGRMGFQSADATLAMCFLLDGISCPQKMLSSLIRSCGWQTSTAQFL